MEYNILLKTETGPHTEPEIHRHMLAIVRNVTRRMWSHRFLKVLKKVSDVYSISLTSYALVDFYMFYLNLKECSTDIY